MSKVYRLNSITVQYFTDTSDTNRFSNVENVDGEQRNRIGWLEHRNRLRLVHRRRIIWLEGCGRAIHGHIDFSLISAIPCHKTQPNSRPHMIKSKSRQPCVVERARLIDRPQWNICLFHESSYNEYKSDENLNFFLSSFHLFPCASSNT